jgi:hypothetical protein
MTPATRRIKIRALSCAAACLAAVAGATLAAAEQKECAGVDARDVVEHARMNGYRFEIAPASSTEQGTCAPGSSASIFIASATVDAGVGCDVRLFWRTAPSPAPTSAETAAGAAATGTAAATSEWVIRWIHIVGDEGYDQYVQGSQEQSDGSERGWTLRISAPPTKTLQFRIDQVAFTTLKECAQWRDAF